MEHNAVRDIKTIEADFNQALASQTFDCSHLLEELDAAHELKAYNADRLAAALQEKLIAAKDIDNLIALFSKRAVWNGDQPAIGQALPEFFKKLSGDRNFARMLDAAKFGKVKTSEALRRLAAMRSFAPGKIYFDKTWGLGEIKSVDLLDSRVIIDFYGKPGHSMSLDHAAESLQTVPDSHVLVLRHRNPEGFAKSLKDEPGRIVRDALISFGPSSIGRLQSLFDMYGIVSEQNWRTFWTKARTDLHRFKDVIVPAKRSDPLYICQDDGGRAFGNAWFERLSSMRDIPAIFDNISEYEKAADKPERSEKASKILSDRLLFAIKGAFLFPPPMFTRLVLMAQRLGIETSKEELAGMLLEDDRFMMAGDKLPVGEAKEMISFIATTRPDAVGTLFDRIPEMGYTLLKQMMATFWSKARTTRPFGKPATQPENATADDSAAPAESQQPSAPVFDPAILKALQDRVRDLLSSTSAPYTLVVWTLRENKWDDLKDWHLPSLYELLDHAVAICEDQAATGESLQMQHMLRDLFVGDYIRQTKSKSKKAQSEEAAAKAALSTWFANVFAKLEPLQQEAMFMRLQSNSAIAEPRYLRMMAETMIAINPALESKRVSSLDAVPEQAPQLHFTSWHSFKNRQEDFRHLVEVEIPKNTQDIAYARSLGDLRENSEYQYAKDQQRILLARREAWSVELEQMHGTTFAELAPDFSTVELATTVTVAKADGSSLSYSILGEWDNDDALHILPSGSRLAKLLLGKKVGDSLAIPTGAGEETVTVTAIAPLPDAVREWIGQPVAE